MRFSLQCYMNTISLSCTLQIMVQLVNSTVCLIQQTVIKVFMSDQKPFSDWIKYCLINPYKQIAGIEETQNISNTPILTERCMVCFICQYVKYMWYTSHKNILSSNTGCIILVLIKTGLKAVGFNVWDLCIFRFLYYKNASQ